jgi:hypothetical protein
MDIPFTVEQFLDVFRQYNESVWPLQIAALLAAAWAIALVVTDGAPGARQASALLALLWLWMGIVYHGMYFSAINPVAPAFAVLFVLEALLLLYYGLVRGRIEFAVHMDTSGVLGALMIAYALLVYPILGALSTHPYPEAPTFGLPCPTTIFTFGMFAWMKPGAPRSLFVIPVLWSVVGVTAATSFGITEDLGLGVAAIIAVMLAWTRERASGHAVIPH